MFKLIKAIVNNVNINYAFSMIRKKKIVASFYSIINNE